MVRFIKVVNTADKVTDCIPIVSTVKNIGILLYQLAHKVNKLNPVKTSWTDDIRIHALSKSDFMAKVASIPFIGNLACLISYVQNAIAKSRGFFVLGGPMGYLAESSRKWYYGTKKHSYEITALHIARNPNRSIEKQEKSLRFAAVGKNEQVFKLILDSRSWSTEVLKDLLKFNHSRKFAELILDKCRDSLTSNDAGEILYFHSHMDEESSLPIIELLISEFPQMDVDYVGRALITLAEGKNTIRPISILFEKFPGISEKDKEKALLKASEKKRKETIELIEEKSPGIVEKNLEQVLKNVAKNHDIPTLIWLFENYNEKVTPKQICMVLSEQASSIYFDKDDEKLRIIHAVLDAYPESLPADDLIQVMESTANLNVKLFGFYLERFTQLEPKHLQKILNEAVYVHGKGNIGWYAENWSQIAQLIQDKFPEMKAEDPHK